MLEFHKDKHKNMQGSIMNVIDSSTLVWISLILYYLTNDTKYFLFYALVCHFLVNIALLFLCPESPAFLYETKQFDRARESLSKIARINGKLPITDIFDTENYN